MPCHFSNSIGACAVVAAALLTGSTAFAQKAALVQEVNVPAKSPYQFNLLFNGDAGHCPNNFFCNVIFPPVPAGKRLVVTHVSAQYSMNSGAVEAAVSIGTGIGNTLDLPAPTYTGGNRFISSSPVTYYFEAGETPIVFIIGSSVITGLTNHASVIGYLVSLP
jgi:hypothetical protein